MSSIIPSLKQISLQLSWHGTMLNIYFVISWLHHSHRLNEPPAEGGVWNGLPWLAHSHAQSSATKTTVDLLSWARRSQWEWTSRQTGKHIRYHIWSAAWQGRGALRLEELSQHGQARASQHWSPEGKRSGERKRPTFHHPRSRAICVNQTNIGTFSRATLGRLLRDGAEHVWAFLSVIMPSWAETETETLKIMSVQFSLLNIICAN